MKRAALGIVAALLILTGCSIEPGNPKESELNGMRVDLPDGRTVLCVVFKSIQEGGISCDWEGAR